MALCGRDFVRLKVVVDDNIIEQASNFNYQGLDVFCVKAKDIVLPVMVAVHMVFPAGI